MTPRHKFKFEKERVVELSVQKILQCQYKEKEGPSSNYDQPVISPDDQYIALGNGLGEIWVVGMKEKGTVLHRKFPFDWHYPAPEWGPDSRSVSLKDDFGRTRVIRVK